MTTPPEAPDPTAGPCGSACLAAALITVAAVVNAVVILQAPPLQSANDRSRWCTVRSLLEDRSYRIDRVRQIPGWDTIDLIRVDGHFYSTKPPLMATWVAGVAAVVQAATGWTFDEHLREIHGTTLLVINGLPFVLWLIVLAMKLPALTSNRATAGFVLIVAAWGTLLSPFLASLNNHTPAAMGVAAALLLWLRPNAAGSVLRQTLRFAAWGFAAAWAVCHDLPAGLFAAAMLWEAWRQSRSATLVGFVPGAALPVIAFFVCNVAATGSWLPAYAGYGGESYRFIHEGVPSYWLNPQGVDRNLDAPVAYLFHCLFGHHGWFSLTPLWLLVVVALPFVQPQESSPHRRLVGWTLLLSAGVLGFYLTRTQNYNYGGVSCGLRWAVFLTPLWIASLAVALDRLSNRSAATPAPSPPSSGERGQIILPIAAIIALAISVYSAWEPLGRPWQQPWLFRVGEQQGWINYQATVPELPRALYGWIAKLPAPDAAAWIEYQRRDVHGATETLRLSQQPDETVGGRTVAVIQAERRRGTDVLEQRLLRIDRERFAAGRPPAECLVWTGPGVTPASQQADLAFYRGLPLMRPYHPGPTRYLKTGLRTDALVCQRAATQVDFGESPLRYRCELWRTDELPFGTARVEWTVTDPVSGMVMQREVWEAAACHPPVAPQSPLTVESFSPPR
jgi:hypothetical protein